MKSCHAVCCRTSTIDSRFVSWELMPVWRYAGNGRLRRAEAPIQKPRCKLEATLFLKPPTTMPTELPPRFIELKRAIAATNPNFEQDLTKAWKEVLAELDKVTKTIAKEGAAVSDMRFVLCTRSTFLKCPLRIWTS
jgi:hypothetical protein